MIPFKLYLLQSTFFAYLFELDTNTISVFQDMPQADLPSCAILILILHYFHTTTFFWMFVEGLYLYILVVETFNRQNIKTHIYMLIGWGK